MKLTKLWQEKLKDSKDLPKIVKIEGILSKKWGAITSTIPALYEVDQTITKVPKGKLITINEIRSILAKKHNALICFPITAGIFAWKSFHHSFEIMLEEKRQVSSYWRTLKTKGEINLKYPSASKEIIKLFESDGHKITKRENKYFTRDYNKKLVKV